MGVFNFDFFLLKDHSGFPERIIIILIIIHLCSASLALKVLHRDLWEPSVK